MDTRRPLVTMLAACAGISLQLAATCACALAQRTFVASTGDDLDPCSRTQPCRSFARAIMQTATNGEIIVLDSAGYGTVAIDKSISIIAPPGIYAGISVSPGSDGVTINATGAKVVLRGLSINGQGGNYGIYIHLGAELHVDRCVVSSMGLAGIRVQGPRHVSISHTALIDNNIGMTAASDSEISIHDSRVERSVQAGVVLDNGARMRASRIIVSGNGNSGITVLAQSPVGVVTEAVIDSSTIEHNTSAGIHADAGNLGSAPEVRVAVTRSSLSHNGLYGVHMASGTVGVNRSAFSENQIAGNGASGIRLHQTSSGLVRSHAAGNSITHNAKGIAIDADVGASATMLSLQDNAIRLNTQNIDGTLSPVNGN